MFLSGESGETEPVEGNHRVQGTDNDLMDGEAEGDTVVIAGQPEVLSTQAMQVINVALLIGYFFCQSTEITFYNIELFSTVVMQLIYFSTLKVENELVDLIDELLERDAGTVNSTIIGKPLTLFVRKS